MTGYQKKAIGSAMLAAHSNSTNSKNQLTQRTKKTYMLSNRSLTRTDRSKRDRTFQILNINLNKQ